MLKSLELFSDRKIMKFPNLTVEKFADIFVVALFDAV
jgi:hypothetical protein